MRKKKREVIDRVEITETDAPGYAVYIFDGCEFIPVSFGDSELECQLWIQCHQDFFKGKEPYIGRVMDSIVFFS